LYLGVLATSTASILIRYAQATAPSLVIAAGRMVLAALVLAPLALLRHRAELRGLRRAQVLEALLAGFLLAVHFATWITSLRYTSVASSVVFVTTTPLWVGLLSPLILKEKLGRKLVIGLAVALLGGIVVGLSDSCQLSLAGLSCPAAAEFWGGRAILGDLLAVAGAVTAAGYMIIGRRLRAEFTLVPYTFVVYGMAALVLGLFLLPARLNPFVYPAPTYAWLLALALVPQLLGHTTFNWALRYLPASFVSVALLGEPIGSTVLALLLLGETPSPMKVGGAVLILGGIFVAARQGPGAEGSPVEAAAVLEVE
jgi:drug/metabolite transporter (DMT)-like permease